jgi:uncharacterized protein (TIGR03032 family)
MMRALGAPCTGVGLLSMAAGDSENEVRAAGNEAPASDQINGSVLVLRDPRTAIAALVQVWESRSFSRAEQPAGWWGTPWTFDLVDGWEDLVGRPLAEICARQWLALELAAIESKDDNTVVVTYEELAADPRAVEARLTEEFGMAITVGLEQPVNPHVMLYDLEEVVAGMDVWPELVEAYLAATESLGVKGYRDPLPVEKSGAVGETTAPSEGTPFASSSTSTFSELLNIAEASVLATTYKSGQVVVLRARDEQILDTYFTPMNRPMGTAIAGNRVAVGIADSIVTYLRHDNGEFLGIEPLPDAVLVPKSVVFTGDVAIHDMAWDADGELWFVNTRFSCLSTLQLHQSFDVRWRPTWISSITAEDRCHLNGLAMVEGRPTYVSALAMTDTAQGWRDHRGTGGVLIDIRDNSVVAQGLSMPHSPRWHENQLWFLESGKGALNVLTPGGSVTQVAELPGFTRGLAFIGPYALVGLSQVRESVFSDLPVTKSAAERNCGIWIVDTRSGEVAGFLRFDANVTELFDVQVLPARWPHIAANGPATSVSFALDESAFVMSNT